MHLWSGETTFVLDRLGSGQIKSACFKLLALTHLKKKKKVFKACEYFSVCVCVCVCPLEPKSYEAVKGHSCLFESHATISCDASSNRKISPNT